MSYGKKRSTNFGIGTWHPGTNVGVTAACLKEKEDKLRRKNFGTRTKEIAELMKNGTPREKIDELIGNPGCSDRDWENAREYLRQKDKVLEENKEQPLNN